VSTAAILIATSCAPAATPPGSGGSGVRAITPPTSAAVPECAPDLQVRLTCDDAAGVGCAAVHYTLDDTPPTQRSTVYTAPIPIGSATTIRFFAVDRAGNEERPHLAAYAVPAPVDTCLGPAREQGKLGPVPKTTADP